eukprot:Ihof_evm1s189 gene=Ihof_evmTU1s189
MTEHDKKKWLVSSDSTKGVVGLRSLGSDIVLKPVYAPGTVGALISAADLPLPSAAVASKRILEEEQYEDSVGEIIERDYFPHVKKMRAQVEYLEAEEDHDIDRMRAITTKYSRSVLLQQPKTTPGGDTVPHMTPSFTSSSATSTPHSKQSMEETKATDGNQGNEVNNDVSLTSFFRKHTSEDDASYPPMFIIYADTKKINFENTRLKENPFKAPFPVKKGEKGARIATGDLTGQPRININGQEKPGTTPRVGGYGFVATPSPSPGMDASPMMTWGSVEDTPFRLGADDVDISSGPIFSLPAEDMRERLANSVLAEKEKSKREKAKPKTPRTLTSQSVGGLGGLSPAARRLASTALGKKGTDGGLRASYSPSPLTRGYGTTPSRTPIRMTPRKADIK